MLALGEWGKGLLTTLETVFLPIPSEVVLPLAGFLSSEGQMSSAGAVTSTLGAYLGALVLYALAARLGRDVLCACCRRLPLVERERPGAATTGSPAWSGVHLFRTARPRRSQPDLVAGRRQRMNLAVFSACTIAGSGPWNGPLIGLGAALGTQYGLVQQYSR